MGFQEGEAFALHMYVELLAFPFKCKFSLVPRPPSKNRFFRGGSGDETSYDHTDYWASTTLMSKPQVVGRIPPKAYYAMHDFKII